LQDFSPWGQIDEEVFILPGIDLVSTPSHGGARVTRDAAMLLSPEARKCGFREGGYLWFEEDCCEQVVLRELMDKKLWTPPTNRIKDPAAYEDAINRVIQAYHPDYWKAREKRINAPPKKTRQRSRAR
jgi:hypothetical protein